MQSLYDTHIKDTKHALYGFHFSEMAVKETEV